MMSDALFSLGCSDGAEDPASALDVSEAGAKRALEAVVFVWALVATSVRACSCEEVMLLTWAGVKASACATVSPEIARVLKPEIALVLSEMICSGVS